MMRRLKGFVKCFVVLFLRHYIFRSETLRHRTFLIQRVYFQS